MTDPVCAAWTSAFLRHLAGSGVPLSAVLVGRDRRPSSPRIAAACAAAIAAEGLTVLDAGVVPTPALALAAAERGVPAVMVTGSHIPFDRNGLKLYRPEGEITKGDEAGILAARREPVALPAARAVAVDVGAAYVDRYVGFYGEGALRGLRLGVYRHSAAGRDLLAGALARLGAEVVPLGDSEAFVPVDTEALDPEVARSIGEWVAEHRLDALLSTDGDGDRPVVADERGHVLRGDALGILAARALGADAVAAPINVSTALERSGWFERTRRTRIGSPYVIEAATELAAEGARLAVGFEANGGFLLAGAARRDGRGLAVLPTRDALLPMLAVLDEAAGAGRPLSGLLATLPARATASARVENVPEAAARGLLARLEESASERERLARAIAGAPPTGFDTIDGLRMTLATGEILHLRPSGNAPELRCYAEAGSETRAEALTAAALARIAGLLATAS
jgi:phosphomannomutase